MTVGERIKECRKNKGLSQKELAEKIGIAPNSLYRYEKGDRNINQGMLSLIASELDVDVVYLLFGVDTLAQKFGLKLRSVRIKKGYSIQDIINEIGVTQEEYDKYEKGEKIPDRITFFKLSDFMKVNPLEIGFLDWAAQEILNNRTSASKHIEEDPDNCYRIISDYFKLNEEGKDLHDSHLQYLLSNDKYILNGDEKNGIDNSDDEDE